MKLLLHICCAPCLIYPLERLQEKGFIAEGFFYNPNIHPFAEYKSRKEAVEKFSKNAGCDLVYPQYLPQEYFQAVSGKETNPGRCAICWRLRLKKTAQAAKDNGFKYFSTTLLVSPYQDQKLLKEIGEDIARQEGIGFYYEDFRLGFREAHHKAHAQGIYCQKYCGCIYSEIERCQK